MISLFELQSQSGQLWIDIKAHLDAKDAERATALSALQIELAANNTEVETLRARTQQAITSATGFLATLTGTQLTEAQQAAVTGLSGVMQFAAKTELQRQLAEAQIQAADATARATAIAAQII